MNAALRSRSQVYEFFALERPALEKILDRALSQSAGVSGLPEAVLEPEARAHWLDVAAGDARRLLNAFEIALQTTPRGPDGRVRVDLKTAEESVQKRAILYDKHGDEHYDTVSAFIKSMRGGDPDAALYWMAKMLEAGDDPRFVARRVIICASEDVGNADPRALVVAAAALQAVEFVGMPEARIPLAQAATYVACAPKSNAAYLGIERAQAEVRGKAVRKVPAHLKDANMDGEARGHGKGYLYPHDYPGHWVEQEYLPDPKLFYEPGGQGEEKNILERLREWRKRK